MEKFHDFMIRYTLGLCGCISSYCKWAESQAKNDKDLLVLGIGPVFALGVLLWSLPGWIGKPIAFILSLPALYMAFLALRAYSVRTGKWK
ncbi:conjugal transfer protein TrbO [Xanthomonas euvesicatoria]